VRPEDQRVYGHRASGFTLIEMMVAAAIVAVMAMIAVPNLQQWSVNQRVKSAGRQVANAFTLARGEAIRTGDLHIVFVQEDTVGSNLTDDDGTIVPVLVINDGRPGDANQNCQVDAGERVFVVYAERDVAWGVSDATVNAPADSGTGPRTSGSTFSDGTGNDATWMMFRPEGVPVAFTAGCAIDDVGTGAGGVYLTNGKRDYAVVVAPLGRTRVHGWSEGTGGWTN
jgi:prepilin-type N-terminal cleavage/methylation domain-containing protein